MAGSFFFPCTGNLWGNEKLRLFLLGRVFLAAVGNEVDGAGGWSVVPGELVFEFGFSNTRLGIQWRVFGGERWVGQICS